MLIYIIAGEPSGDALGARLMLALRQRCGGTIQFAGIGGEAMTAAGLTSLFPMEELSIMGLAEVLPSLWRILRRVRQTQEDIHQRQPVAVITIDSWGFCGRIQKFCRDTLPDVARIHYVAPMVWAWKPKRAKKLAKVVELLLTLLPFEPQWFTPHGLRTEHVGHSVLESGADRGDGAAFRQQHEISADAPVLLALLGSRKQEIHRLAPVYAETVAALAQHFPNLVVVVPTVAAQAARVRALVVDWPVRCIIVDRLDARYDAFAAGTVALAASGTVALELALAGVPTLITYRVSRISHYVATRFLGLGKGLKWATLVNILLDRMAVPEFLQQDCRADRLTAALTTLLTDPVAQGTMKADMRAAMQLLGEQQASPSLRAADAVLEFIAARTGEGEPDAKVGKSQPTTIS